MSVVNNTSTTSTSELAQLLFKKVDRNGDNQVSSDEFKSFLAAILGGMSTAAASGARTAATTMADGGTPPAASTDGLPFAPVPGFNLEKLRDLTHVNDKYTASVRLFSQALAATGAQPDAAGLQKVVEWLNAHGASASAKRDMLTINNDAPVDVITDYEGPSSTWWFHNLA